jgi:dipeptidyl aminopeptidase/acylaminoacyl peptidase
LITLIDIDLTTSTASSIFDKTQKIANVVIDDAGTAKIDGHYYKYFTGLAFVFSKARIKDGNGGYSNKGDYRNLYRVNLDTHEITLEARGGEGPGFKWVVDSHGAVVAHSQFDTKTGVWRLYAGEGTTKLLSERKAEAGRVLLKGQGRKPGTVWITDSRTASVVVEEISISDGRSEVLFDGARTLRLLEDPDSGLGVGALTTEEPRAIFLDQKWQARLAGTRKAFADIYMYLVSFSRNLDQMIVQTAGGDDSGTYWLVDIASGSADPIGQEYPDVRPADVGPVSWFSYKAGDALDIKAVLTLPPQQAAGKLPLVVMPHDGPVGEDILVFDWWAQAFAANGYAVLQPNYRGSIGAGPGFLRAGNGQWGRKMQTDLSDGVAALAAKGIIDPKRVCIVGLGYGGYAALAGLTMQKDIYRCGVSVGGDSDLSATLQLKVKQYGYESEVIRLLKRLTGTDVEGDGSLKTLSPINFAQQAGGPILLIHGSDDVVVSIDQSRDMAAALREAAKPVELIELQDEDHWLSRDATRKAMVRASVEFVRKHNPPN